MTDLQERYATKIAALLEKAESTTPEEAELLLEKAQELMAKYAIEEALVAKARGAELDEKIVEKTINYKSSYHHALFAIGDVVARQQGCRVLISRRKNQTTMFVAGFESDVERTIMLDASVQIQAKTALSAAARRGEVRSEVWMTAMDKFKERRTFLIGFADGLETRLARANRAGREEYKTEAVSAGADAGEVSSGMELVLRSRKDRVNDWVDRHHGKLRAARGGLSAYGSGSAHRPGHEAGLRADTGSAGRVGQRRALNR